MATYGTLVAVDDQPAIRTALKITLAPYFERVETLASPEALLPLLAAGQVEAVLLDMNFALGMNSGHEGLQWLRTVRRLHPDVPVVLMTAYAEVRLAVRALKAGAADFVTKPWDNDELIRTLKDAIDRSAEVVPLNEMEAEHVRRVVDRCGGNISRAAQLLGITRQTLYTKLRRP